MIRVKMASNRGAARSLAFINVKLLTISFLILAAFAIRMSYASEPPLNFHATRQYRSLLIARAFYYESQPDIPVWEKQIARINQERQGVLEPPIMEMLVALGYRLIGGENFWVPRFLSSLFWIIGSGLLYRIAKKIASEKAALFSLAYYLFLPFAVIASRSFQPDPLMVMLLLASIFFIIRYQEQQAFSRFAACCVCSAAAILVKPVALFTIYTVFGLLTIYQCGIKKALTRYPVYLFSALALLPTLLFYLRGIFQTGVLQDQAESSFLPQLLLSPFFWRGWLANIHEVIGFTVLILSILAVLLAQRGFTRILLVGLWAGYGLFCLVFDYHIATHNYYHLQLIPIVALSLSPAVTILIERLQEINQDWYGRMAIGAVAATALLLSLMVARAALPNPDYQSKVSAAQKIGELVQHSPNTVYLEDDYGFSLEYHGELSGKAWPLASDLEWERLAGVPVLNAEARFQKTYAADHPQYFIIGDRNEFDQQDDLKVFLARHAVLLASQDDYIIYQLR